MKRIIDKKVQAFKMLCINAYVNTIHPAVLRHVSKRIGKKDKIEVVFFAFNVAMWRYQGVYDLLSRDKRFNCHIVLTINVLSSKEQQQADLNKMRSFFATKGIQYIDYNEEDINGFDVKRAIHPDILFYPQHYGHILPKNHDFKRFLPKLLCYIPYGLSIISEYDNYRRYNTPFQNVAWKLYYPSSHNKEESEKVSFNHGRNMVVSGYPNVESYICGEAEDVWKIADRAYKRLIWSPHFTITSGLSSLNMSNFLWMSQLMLEIAQKYQDRLQIAFKPHPWLKSKLYNHPDWGQERTDLYYNQWSNMDNTMLETAGFIDLFKTSDALLNDSDSFVTEYMYVNKPVAFVAKNKDAMSSDFSTFGLDILKHQYVLHDKEGILSFIEDVVLAGNDTMKSSRTLFVNGRLKLDSKLTSSQIIVNDIKRSLGIAD